MVQKPTRKHLLTLLSLILFLSSIFIPTVLAWSNGGYSSNPSNPDYGTHDWIVQHAKNWLPAVERKWIDDNLNYFLYGTEYPDNSGASYGTTKGYGDTTKHHNYYDSSGSVTDDSAAIRAKVEYDKALVELKAGRNVTAAIYAGSMSHYIVDIAVFGHVLNNEIHHSDYEDYVGTRTASYGYGVFELYLVFDGNLENVSAYDASISLGRNTFNDGGGIYTANWMDAHYDWSSPVFKNRCGESLNLATNYVADVLHTLSVAAFGTTIATKSSSSISCSISSSSLIVRDSLTVSGSISPSVSGKIVTLTYTKPNGTTVTRTVASGSNGAYDDSYKPDTSGSWSVKASWEGNNDYQGATSSSVIFTVTGPPKRGSLKILVQDEKGSPISGATITSTIQPSDQTSLTSYSESDGTYTFTNVIVGNYAIKVTKSGYSDNNAQLIVIADQTTSQTIQLNRLISSVKIFVKDTSANLLSGVSFTSTSQPTGQSTLSGTTASDGSVIFNDVKPGAYTFMASKSGFKSKSDSLLTLAEETTEKSIILEPESQPSGGIPGFPTESIVFGLMLIIGFFVIYRSRKLGL